MDLLPNEDNPYENYGEIDKILDYPVFDAFARIPTSKDHLIYANRMPDMIEKHRPGLYDELGGRVDRNKIDMMLNYIGAYDWMARKGGDPENAIDAARAYQYKDYETRPYDSVMDYHENAAGVRAFDPAVGRVDDAKLVDMAEQFAIERMGLLDQLGR